MTRNATGLAVIPAERPRLDAPRGRLIDAKAIVDRFFIDPDGRKLVTQRWVRDNMPHKIPLSHSRVVWYDGDVERVLVEAARTGRPIRDINLFAAA